MKETARVQQIETGIGVQEMDLNYETLLIVAVRIFLSYSNVHSLFGTFRQIAKELSEEENPLACVASFEVDNVGHDMAKSLFLLGCIMDELTKKLCTKDIIGALKTLKDGYERIEDMPLNMKKSIEQFLSLVNEDRISKE